MAPGKAVGSEDPQARRPATSSGHARTHWAGCPDVETDPSSAASAAAWASYRFAVTGDVCRGSVLSVPLSDPAQRDIDPLELYASAIDASDYVVALAPLIRQAVPEVGHLLDVGAGGGQLGMAIHDPARSWTAIEPSPTMRARLVKLTHPPRIIAAGWEQAEVAPGHDTVLAATMPAFFDHPEVLPRALPRLGAHRRLDRAGARRAARPLLRGLPAARVASRGRDARHRHHHAWPRAFVAATACRLRRLDLHWCRARPS